MSNPPGLPNSPGLPIPVLADDAPDTRIRCVLTPVDRDGRLADRSAVRFLGWSAGQPVGFAVTAGPVVVASAGGERRVNPRGHLRVPLVVRRTCRITTGDRLLVVADPRRGELLMIPMATLLDLLAADRQASEDGAGR